VAVEDYMLWRTLLAEWSCVRDYYRRYSDSIHPGQPLPRRLEVNLSTLESALLVLVDRRKRASVRVYRAAPRVPAPLEVDSIEHAPRYPGKRNV
jgi:hypothetical protein